MHVANAAEEPLANPSWDLVEIAKCGPPGMREWSAKLRNIPWGESWERWCYTFANENTRPNSNGAKWGKPHHCCNVANTGIYGVWLLPDTNCP
jgi:hypothetical protein